MAELIESSNDVQAARKRGKYLPAEDLIIIREVAAIRAHVATYGNVRQSFEKVANKINQNPHMSQKVNWKAVQDRYKRLQDDFDADDVRNSNLSGIAGGEMGELYQALSQMREERDTFLQEKKADKTEKNKREEEKEAMGRHLVEMALVRKRQKGDGSEVEEDSDSGADEKAGDSENGAAGGSASASGNGGSAKKKRKKRRKLDRIDVGGDLALFGENLKEAELARVQLQADQLEFEKEKYAREVEEREKERDERRKEREEAQKMELEKFKVMFDVFKQLKQ